METGRSKEVFGSNFRRLLNKAQKKRADFVRDTGEKFSTVTDWYYGRSFPRADKLDMIANYFKVPSSYLIEDHALSWDDPITDAAFTATDDEEILIRKIRALDDKDTEIIERYVDAMYDRLTGDEDGDQ